MEKSVIRIQGLLELSVILFLMGIFTGTGSLVVAGGIIMLINDVIAMGLGALNPLFPIILAIALGVIIQPWYVGVFWSLAVFHVLDLPNAFKKVSQGTI